MSQDNVVDKERDGRSMAEELTGQVRMDQREFRADQEVKPHQGGLVEREDQKKSFGRNNMDVVDDISRYEVVRISQRGTSADKQTLADRLFAISIGNNNNRGVEKLPRGKWMEKVDGIGSDEELSEEEIKQHNLPAKQKVENEEFKEPLMNWISVEKSVIPSWRKDLLPEEENIPDRDWIPHTAPRVDISLQMYKEEFVEETPILSKIRDIVKDKEMVLAENLEEDDEVVLLNNSCIIRTTKAGIKKSKRNREIEDDEEGQRKRVKWEDTA
jgi:hypothetical protein